MKLSGERSESGLKTVEFGRRVPVVAKRRDSYAFWVHIITRRESIFILIFTKKKTP